MIDPSELFSQESYDTMLALLAGEHDSQMEGLMMLSNTVIYGNSSLLRRFPAAGVCTRLVEIMCPDSDLDLKEMVCECLANLLQADPDRAPLVSSTGLLKKAASVFMSMPSVSVGEKCVGIFDSVAEVTAVKVVKSGGMEAILKHMPSLGIIYKRQASKTVLKVAKAVSSSRLIPHTEDIIRCCSEEDETVMSNCVMALANVLESVDEEEVNLNILAGAVGVLNKLETGTLMNAMMHAMMMLSTKERLARAMLPNKIDFERVFFGPDFKGSTEGVRRKAMNIILNLLPDAKLPAKFWILREWTLPGADDFGREMRDFSIKLLLRKAARETLTLAMIHSCLEVEAFDPPEEMLIAMAELVQSPIYAPFVLLVSKGLPDKKVLVKTGILPVLRTAVVDDEVKEWYEENLKLLVEMMGDDANAPAYAPIQIQNFRELCDFMSKNDLAAYEFRLSGLLKRANEFLSEMTTVEDADLPVIVKMVDMAHKMLNFLPISQQSDPFTSLTPTEVAAKSLDGALKSGGDDISGISIGSQVTNMATEWWNNSRRGVTSDEKVVSNLAESEFSDVIVVSNPNALTMAHKGVISRGIGQSDYVLYHIRINEREFSAYGNVFHSVARSMKSTKEFEEKIAIEIVEGDIERPPLEVPCDFTEGIMDTMTMLKRIQKIAPSVDVQREAFTKHIFHQLASPALTMGFLSAASKMVYHFPFMFDFDLRLAYWRIIGFDLMYSLPHMDQYFYGGLDKDLDDKVLRSICVVRRDHIFEDGMSILKVVGHGPLRLEVSYKGEEGIGIGPTQEFMTLFGNSFCEKKRCLWRNENTDDKNIYAFHTNGLFPAPKADPKMFYWLGLLVGKSMLMDMVMPIPFNPAFFKVALGREITLAEVEPAIASSLAYSRAEDMDGVTFVSPGYPDVLLKEGGDSIEVTAENFEEYKTLVKQSILNVSEAVGEFKRALSTMVEFDALRIFSGGEVVCLISGQGIGLTREDLESSVMIGHGYTRESPQIQMLFDTILEMTPPQRSLLVKFITGGISLPVGGLKNLKPLLTVAVRATYPGQEPDDTLPSVMTCTNYLKIPQYSCREVLCSKLLSAISECQSEFWLT